MVDTYNCGILNSLPDQTQGEWYFEEVVMVLRRSGVVRRRGCCGTLKRVVWFVEEGVVVLWRGYCGTLKRVVWYYGMICIPIPDQMQGRVLLWAYDDTWLWPLIFQKTTLVFLLKVDIILENIQIWDTIW